MHNRVVVRKAVPMALMQMKVVTQLHPTPRVHAHDDAHHVVCAATSLAYARVATAHTGLCTVYLHNQHAHTPLKGVDGAACMACVVCSLTWRGGRAASLCPLVSWSITKTDCVFHMVLVTKRETCEHRLLRLMTNVPNIAATGSLLPQALGLGVLG
jgi:hypothetical protein